MNMPVKKDQEDLKKQEFSTIPAISETWQEVLQYGNRIERPKGHALLSGGMRWKTLYYLAQGEVQLIRLLPDGRERLLWVGVAPSLVGECPFFDQMPANSSIIISKPSILYAFSESWVHNTLLVKYPKLTLSLLRNMANKLRVIHNQSVCVSMDVLPSRICKFLYQRLGPTIETQPDCVRTGLTQQELASLLSTHRVTLNKALRELENEGILGPYSKKEVYILDMERFLSFL